MNEQELWDRSAEAWIRHMEKGDPSRTLVLDPVMLAWAGNVAELKVCDVGCGEGRFCRMLAERGANVTGVEPTKALISKARAQHKGGSYVQAGGGNLPFLDESFDLIICYLVLIDIPDFRAAIREMGRVCRLGGRLLVANLNPFMTTRPAAWEEDQFGHKLFVRIDDYMTERPERVAWSGIEVINYHRPLSSYMQAFLSTGMRLTRFDEPVPSPDTGEKLGYARKVPYFHVMEWTKG